MATKKSKKTKAKGSDKRPIPRHGDNDRSVHAFRNSFILLMAGFLVYLPTLDNPMVFDDLIFLEGNPAMSGSLLELWQFNPSRFLVMLTFYINQALHGLSEWGYHLVNMILHLLTGLAAWQLALAILRNTSSPTRASMNLVALGTGLIVILHPLQTQAVTYIWQRSALMATLFYLGAILAWFKHRESGKVGISIPTLLMGLAAMLCKEIAFTLPLALILVELVLFGARPAVALKRNWPYLLLLPVIPLLFLISAQQYEAMLAQETSARILEPLHYLLTQPRVFLTYLRLLILPYGQNLDYDYPVSPGFGDLITIGALVLAVALALGSALLVRHNKVMGFAALFIILGLSVEALAFTLPDVIFEHRLYLSMFGFGLLVCSAAATRLNSNAYTNAMTVLVLILAVMSFNRNRVWDSPLSLWRDTSAKSPMKARPHINHGVAAIAEGKNVEALKHLDQALEIRPEHPIALLHRAMLHQKEDRQEKALADFDNLIDLRPDDAKILNNRGAVHLTMKRYREAMMDFQKALEHDPNYLPAHKNLGSALHLSSRHQEALEALNRALELDPDDGGIYHLRAGVLRDLMRTADAEADYTASLKRNERNHQVHVDYSTLLYESGRVDEAQTHLTRALDLEPKYKPALINRGSIAFNAGDFQQAIADFTTLIELKPEGDLFYRRGAAWLNLGQREKALSDLQQAKSMGFAVSPELLERAGSL